jgi:hypothetical protein
LSLCLSEANLIKRHLTKPIGQEPVFFNKIFGEIIKRAKLWHYLIPLIQIISNFNLSIGFMGKSMKKKKIEDELKDKSGSNLFFTS